VLLALAAAWGLSWKIERSARSENQLPKSDEFSTELRSAA
jgi:hypothetical protein